MPSGVASPPKTETNPTEPHDGLAMTLEPFTRQQFRLTGRHVLLGLVAFLGVPAVVNLVYLYWALDTWPGRAEESPYRQGLSYNEQIDAIARQNELGWRAELLLSRDADEPKLVIAEVSLIDGNGGGVSAEGVRGRLVHPMQEIFDSPVLQAESTTRGRYWFAEKLPRSGAWRFRFTTKAADGTPFRRDFEFRLGEAR